ncbi:MAG: SIR2 family protein [Nitrospira sp.]|nr:MAG: SIR2 family protein [Nitrospira sp.]
MYPLVKLAAAGLVGEKKYVLFAGAGISKDAGLPTGWDLMMATAKLLRAGESDQDESLSLEDWFQNSRYSKLSYGELIGGLFSTAVLQQEFMRKHLHAERPGDAHQLVAKLAQLGVIRCVITTNFDKLLEQAIERAGLRVQVISNAEDLEHSEPLIHCRDFRVYKPHGTLGVGQIRNTPFDLELLASNMDEELVRVISDHGLLILGYAGRDAGIINCFRRSRRGHFPTFWINLEPPKPEVREAFTGSVFEYVECQGAAEFLKRLLDTYSKLGELEQNATSSHSAVNKIQDAILGGRGDLLTQVQKFMQSLNRELVAVAPDFSMEGDRDELLVQSIAKTIPLAVEFAKVASVVSENNSESAALAIFKGFGALLEKYDTPRGFSGSYYPTDFDYFAFMGHELFIIFLSLLIEQRRWDLVAEILQEEIYINNVMGGSQGPVSYLYFSKFVRLLNVERNERLSLNRISVEADLLWERHSKGDLADVSPFRGIRDADLFLYLRSEFEKERPDQKLDWLPWSVVFLADEMPQFLLEASRKKYALQLLRPLSAKSIEDLRLKCSKAREKLPIIFGRGFGLYESPLYRLDSSRLGSRD